MGTGACSKLLAAMGLFDDMTGIALVKKMTGARSSQPILHQLRARMYGSSSEEDAGPSADTVESRTESSARRWAGGTEPASPTGGRTVHYEAPPGTEGNYRDASMIGWPSFWMLLILISWILLLVGTIMLYSASAAGKLGQAKVDGKPTPKPENLFKWLGVSGLFMGVPIINVGVASKLVHEARKL